MSAVPAPPPISWWGHTWRTSLVLLASAVVWAVGVAAADGPDSPITGARLTWLLLVDPALGAVAFVLTLFRRRWPLAVGVVVTAISTVAATAVGPWTLTLASVATRRSVRELAVVVPLSVGAGFGFEVVYPQVESLSLWVALLVSALVVAVVVAVGWSVGADRDRLRSLRERAETSEREQQARVSAARAAERTRIAREMHDVLAHRISLVSMHAGALTFRTDLPEGERAAVARTIEENAHLALRDLRDVLGVLRAEDPDLALAPEKPQPDLGDLPRLVTEAREAGTTVTLGDDSRGEVPATLARTVFRVVQEALTNARKHAPGCTVTVTVAGGDGDPVTVTVVNPLPLGTGGTGGTGGVTDRVPGAGLGLLGLRERVDLLGGTLAHGPESGRFVLRASLPWPGTASRTAP